MRVAKPFFAGKPATSITFLEYRDGEALQVMLLKEVCAPVSHAEGLQLDCISCSCMLDVLTVTGDPLQ